eukprot:gene9710-biopygen7129
MRNMLHRGEVGDVQGGSLKLHFRCWPREWQVQPWCAGRAHGGPLREVGTHFLFGILELFGHGSVARVCASVHFPDGPAGHLAEDTAEGILELTTGVRISLSVRTDLRDSTGDICQLEVQGSGGKLMLQNFTSLSMQSGSSECYQPVLQNVSYGRTECIDALLEAIKRADRDTPKLVTPKQGRNAARVLDAILESNGTWIQVVSN